MSQVYIRGRILGCSMVRLSLFLVLFLGISAGCRDFFRDHVPSLEDSYVGRSKSVEELAQVSPGELIAPPGSQHLAASEHSSKKSFADIEPLLRVSEPRKSTDRQKSQNRTHQIKRTFDKQRPFLAFPSYFLRQKDEELLHVLSSQVIRGARGTSGVSLSMYLDLEGDINAAFKPETRTGQRWNGEVAAYRLNRLLGLNRVPPALTRWIRLTRLQAVLADNPVVLERLNNEAIERQKNLVRGAIMYWVPTIHSSEIDRIENLEHWTQWLRQGKLIPPKRKKLVQQLSDLIVFDYVTGNWDRWSGGNVFWGPEKKVLLIMDNNGAFNVKLNANLESRLEEPLLQVEKFSELLYRRLIGLSREDIKAEFALDTAGEELLSEEQIKALLERRDKFVERVERLERKYGHKTVLCFH